MQQLVARRHAHSRPVRIRSCAAFRLLLPINRKPLSYIIRLRHSTSHGPLTNDGLKEKKSRVFVCPVREQKNSCLQDPSICRVRQLIGQAGAFSFIFFSISSIGSGSFRARHERQPLALSGDRFTQLGYKTVRTKEQTRAATII